MCKNHASLYLVLGTISAVFALSSAETTYHLKATIQEDSKAILQKWIKRGGKTRLDIHPTFSSELSLPAGAEHCPDRNETDWSVDEAQLIFDWCAFEWEIEGNYGVWDDDFRFEIYSMGITKWATANIRVDVEFEDSAPDEAKTFFRDCLPLANKIEEISHAIKAEIDHNHKGLRETAAHNHTAPSTATPTVNASVCDDEQKWVSRFGEGLETTTILCFKAIRPLGAYLNFTTPGSTDVDGDESYRLTYVCLRGNNRLQDWSITLERDQTLSQDLSTEIADFEYAILTILVLFFPLVILAIVPWDEDMTNTCRQKAVNVIDEEARSVFRQSSSTSSEGPDANDEGALTNVKVHDIRDESRRVKGCEDVKFTVIGEKDVRGVLTLEKKKAARIPWSGANFFKMLLTCTLDTEALDWRWRRSEDRKIGDEDRKATKSNQNGAIHRVEDPSEATQCPSSKYDLIALDATTPGIVGLRSLFTGAGTGTGAVLLTSFRRFVFIILASCNAIGLMLILDRVVFKRTITRLIEFRREHRVEIIDLGYWNYFNVFDRIGPLEAQYFVQWDVFLIFLAGFWCFSVFIYSFPGVMSYCVKTAYPSRSFGFFDVVFLPQRHTHLFGLRLVYAGLLNRMGFAFDASFWSRLKRKVFQRCPKSQKLSMKRLLKGFISLFCIVSVFPVITMFPPLYSWNKKYWPKAGLFFIISGTSYSILLVLVVSSLKIYLRFALFTVTAIIFHYQVTIGMFSIAAGCIGFLASIASQIKNSYLRDKILIHAIITEIHGAKMLEFAAQRNIVLEHNKAYPGNRIFVPELIWWWSQESWSCIPLKLYDNIVLRLRPLGSQRAKIILKIVVMGIFITFVFTVMNTLGMTNTDSAFDAMKMVITVVAVVVPSLIAKLQSPNAKAICQIQKKGVIREETERFLKENSTYYMYDIEIPALDKHNHHFNGENQTLESVESLELV